MTDENLVISQVLNKVFDGVALRGEEIIDDGASGTQENKVIFRTAAQVLNKVLDGDRLKMSITSDECLLFTNDLEEIFSDGLDRILC